MRVLNFLDLPTQDNPACNDDENQDDYFDRRYDVHKLNTNFGDCPMHQADKDNHCYSNTTLRPFCDLVVRREEYEFGENNAIGCCRLLSVT